ncbi:MAG: glycosyltransferase family 2 protein, partial [Phycisphaerales bacterium]
RLREGPELSVVVPAYNEEANLRELHRRLSGALSGEHRGVEFIFVDDGSRDGTAAVIRELAAGDSRVRYVLFSRNFGHEAATTAGLDRARGRACVIIDADLQDPPELIPSMMARWREGVQVVYAQRRHRAGEGAFKRLSAWAFYRVLAWLSDVAIPRDTGDFRLMDAKVVAAVRQCRENPRFIRGLVAWAGFRQEALPYDRDARHAGETNYNFVKLVRLSLEAIMAFSLKPLKMTMWLGLATITVSVVLAVVVIAQRLLLGTPMFEGYAFLATSLFFLGGIQLTMLGIMAHYLAHIFRHTQARPLYLVAEEESHNRAPDDDLAAAVRGDAAPHEQIAGAHG